MDLDDGTVRLDWESTPVWLSKRFEPEHYNYEIAGGIKLVTDEDEGVAIGRHRSFYVDISAGASDGLVGWDVFDAHGGTMQYYPVLLKGDIGVCFTEKVERLVGGDVCDSNLLILDRIELLPDFRGQELGLEVAVALMRRFSAGTGLICMLPLPSQFEENSGKETEWQELMRLIELSKNPELSARKLRRYWGRLGFRQLRGSPFMFRASCLNLPEL